MAGGWPSRIVGRSVGLRGGTARQSRPRGSVLGSAASRCVVDYPLLPHSLTVSSVARTFSTFARPLDSRRFSLSLHASLLLSLSLSRFSFATLCFGFTFSSFSVYLSTSVSSSIRHFLYTHRSTHHQSPFARNPVFLPRSRVRHAATTIGAVPHPGALASVRQPIWNAVRETRPRQLA